VLASIHSALPMRLKQSTRCHNTVYAPCRVRLEREPDVACALDTVAKNRNYGRWGLGQLTNLFDDASCGFVGRDRESGLSERLQG